MELVIHRISHFGTQNNVRLQRYAGLQGCRIREVSLCTHIKNVSIPVLILPCQSSTHTHKYRQCSKLKKLQSKHKTHYNLKKLQR